MLLDRQNLVSIAQALTTGTITSTDVIDLGTDGMNNGQDLDLFASIVTALVGGTSVQFVVQDSADNSSFTTQWSSRAYTTAELNAAGHSPIRLGDLPHKCRRYVRLQYVIVGTYSAGAVTAGIVQEPQTNV